MHNQVSFPLGEEGTCGLYKLLDSQTQSEYETSYAYRYNTPEHNYILDTLKALDQVEELRCPCGITLQLLLLLLHRLLLSSFGF